MLPLALTTGDPSGIGLEITLAAWRMRRATELPAFYLVCDPRVAAARAKLLGLDVAVKEASPDQAASLFPEHLPVVPLASTFVDRPGKPVAENAAGVIESIDRCVADAFAGKASAVVTNPIAKKTLYEAGFAFPGHTEYLAELVRKETGRTMMPVMMLAGPELRAVPVTIHIPLADVPAALSSDLIIRTGRIVNADLRDRFGIVAPRLAISGLNPHAGEGGSMGSEEIDVIGPAIARLRDEGVNAFGPLPADTMFHTRARAGYDAALCMYHDQALIPAKALAFDETVNVTLGLPIARTSPDHGTAFDIAGKGIARPDSLIAALKLAARLGARAAAPA